MLFGATGDLAKRKLFPALYRMAEHDHLGVPMIGVSRSDWKDDDFHQHAAEAIRAAIDDADQAVIDKVCAMRVPSFVRDSSCRRGRGVVATHG